MTAVLRLGIAAMSTIVTLVGSFVLAFGASADRTHGSAVIAAGAFALVAMATPPALIGMFVSYWSWDASARRRLRILLAVLLGLQVLGAAGLAVLAAAAPKLLVGAVVLIVISLAQTPVSIALGRAARRRELQAPPPALDGADAAILGRIRGAWRRVVIGATIGLVLGIALLVGLTAFSNGDSSASLAFLMIAPVGLGASIGGLTSTLPLARKMRDLLGGEYSSARRIGLAIKGEQQQLTSDEAARAARYTAVAPAWLNLQLTTQAANLVVSLSVIAGLATEHGTMRWLLPILGGVMLVGTVTVIVLRQVQIRRLRAYAASHPVIAGP